MHFLAVELALETQDAEGNYPAYLLTFAGARDRSWFLSDQQNERYFAVHEDIWDGGLCLGQASLLNCPHSGISYVYQKIVNGWNVQDWQPLLLDRAGAQ